MNSRVFDHEPSHLPPPPTCRLCQLRLHACNPRVKCTNAALLQEVGTRRDETSEREQWLICNGRNRLFKFPQMDFEMAIWEMTSLLIAPKKVFKSIYYHVSGFDDSLVVYYANHTAIQYRNVSFTSIDAQAPKKTMTLSYQSP